uniref:histidinol-phosphatase n=1 Tax=uncultured Planktosalinus sp. TaxID=1810935 RepID=UPI0030D84A41
MKKVLFIDRDGTLVIEPPIDYQLDSLEKLEFYPGVFQYLARIATELDFELVMVTNQDGLGTASFPEDTFWPAQNKIIQAFENEEIYFSEILIDKSLPEDNAPTRKPGTALLTHYIKGNYDLENSYVIGDRATDVQLARNLGSKAIYISDSINENATLNTTSWREIYTFLKTLPRKETVMRNTNETQISVTVNLDGSGKSKINTGLGFFDHMLEQIAKHGNLDLEIQVQGDLHIDEHHTIEDVAITFGEAFLKALGS